MKLILKNFRCHEDSTFEIPDKGLILLSGESGAGKSTILNALFHVFFGSVRKPYSYMATTCSVELEFEGVKIKRTNKPNKLSFEDDTGTYINSEAQNKINDFLRVNQEEFMLSSYVIQSLHNSVVSLSPSEQSKLVEKIAFEDNFHSLYREKIKNHLRDVSEKSILEKGKLEVLTKQIKDVKSKTSIQKNESIDVEEIKINLLKTEDELKKLNEKMFELSKKYEKNAKEEKLYSSIRDNIKRLENEILDIEEKISEIKEDISDKDINEIETHIKKLEKYKNNLDLYKEKEELSEKLETYKNEYDENIQSKINKYQQNVLTKKQESSIKTKIKSAKSNEEKYQKALTEYTIYKNEHEISSKNIEDVRNFLSEIYELDPKTDLDELLRIIEVYLSELKDEYTSKSSEILTCPSCNSKLILDDGNNLKEIPKTKGRPKKTSTVTEKKKLDELKKLIADVDDKTKILKSSIDFVSKKPLQEPIKNESVSKYQKTLDLHISSIEKINHYKDLENKFEEQSHIKDMVSRISSLNSYLKKFSISKNMDKKIKSIESIKEELSDLKHKNSDIISLNSSISKKKEALEKLRKKLPDSKFLKSEGDDTTTKMANIRKHISKKNEQLEKLKEHSSAIEEHDRYVENMKLLDGLNTDLLKVQKEYEMINQEVEGTKELDVVAKEAEVIAMVNTIDSINDHADIYLRQLFDDNIEVKLVNSKKIESTKQIKIQMNTSIKYKGNDCDITDLSGGEVQRVELAFTLAINDMLNSKFILLDECLNNLDSELNMKALEFLKEISSQKIIIVVSHEANEGIFDDIVHV